MGNQSLANPFFRNGAQTEAIWRSNAAGVELAMSNFQGAFNEINITGLNGAPFFGQLTGSKSSDATNCGSAPQVTASMESIFQLAEQKLPLIFPSGSVTLFLDQYVYRFYQATGVYVAFTGGQVFLLGGPFGSEIINPGSLDFVLNTLEAYQAPNTGGGNPTPGGGSPELWNLSITGSVTTFGFTNSFQGLQINDVPAPDLTYLNEVNEEIITTLQGVATGISQIQIDVLTNTSNERSFRVQFSATANGLAIAYDLTYTYTR